MPISDFLPTPPWEGPPIPNFLTRNPGTWKAWTSPEEYTRVAEKAGDWATARSAAMLSKADIMAGKLDVMADSMYRRMLSRLAMVPAPPVAVPRKERKPRVEKAPVPKEEVVVPAVKIKRARTTDVDELIRVASDWRKEKKMFPCISEIEIIAREKGFEVSDAQVKKIVNALREEKPILLEEIKPGVIEWIKSTRAPGEWPPLYEIENYTTIEYHGFKLADGVAAEWLEEAKKEG